MIADETISKSNDQTFFGDFADTNVYNDEDEENNDVNEVAETMKDLLKGSFQY